MSVELFVNGTLMRGFALHRNLDGAQFLGECHTAPVYRLFTIDDAYPGMFEVADGEPGGVSVTGELYRMSDEIWARVKAGEPPHVYKGVVKLEDGRTVDGILFPRAEAEGKHPEISRFGGWQAYVASRLEGDRGAAGYPG